MARPLRIGIVAGEESGDLLAADLVAALARAADRPVELVGVGGRHLEAQGLKPLFDGDEIALMGVTAVLRDLPRLIARIGSTARAIVAARPDCLVTVDSPEFSLRVARRVKAALPDLPCIHYVCPSVWAWRPARAPAMKAYVDEVLCVLPFEPEALSRLGGPPGTYVGHRLVADEGLAAAAVAQRTRQPPVSGMPRRLVVLPGSRRGEVEKLAGLFGEAVGELARGDVAFSVTIPTIPRVAALVAQAVGQWPVQPEIVRGREAFCDALAGADCAMAASGTATLELALARVPFISCYKADWLATAMVRRSPAWSASLPNLIAGWPVVPEYYNDMVRPPLMARMVAQLWDDTPTRAAQLAGFDQIAEAMSTDRPAGELAAETVLARLAQRRAIGT
jgi:lipid-A-disaccharide synthase